jgi:hypothetical protein
VFSHGDASATGTPSKSGSTSRIIGTGTAVCSCRTVHELRKKSNCRW